MAVARQLRTARRRPTPWHRVVVVAVVAVAGGMALWSSYSYGEAHTAARAKGQDKRGASGGQQEQRGGGDKGDGKGDPSASLDAWMQLTDLPGKAAGGGGGAGQQQQQQQQGKKEEGGKAAGGGSSDVDLDLSGPAKYLTLELSRLPKTPPTYNSWVLTEDMLIFNRRVLQQQLEQLYVALGVAAATGRTLILPEFKCFCQNSDAPLPKCRRPGEGDSLQFPVPCPESEILVPLAELAAGGEERGTPLRVLPHAALKKLNYEDSKVLRLVPSAIILWPACTQPPGGQARTQCTMENAPASGPKELMVPPSLNNTHLLPFLEPYQEQYPLWVLDLSDIGSHWHAFQGWDCKEPALQFDKRLRNVALPWPNPSGPGMLPMNMTTGRVYSDEPDMKDCGPGGKAPVATRRLQGVAGGLAAAVGVA